MKSSLVENVSWQRGHWNRYHHHAKQRNQHSFNINTTKRLVELYMVLKKHRPSEKFHWIPLEKSTKFYFYVFQQLGEKTPLFNVSLKSDFRKENRCLQVWGKRLKQIVFCILPVRGQRFGPKACCHEKFHGETRQGSRGSRDQISPDVFSDGRLMFSCALDTVYGQCPWPAQRQNIETSTIQTFMFSSIGPLSAVHGMNKRCNTMCACWVCPFDNSRFLATWQLFIDMWNIIWL